MKELTEIIKKYQGEMPKQHTGYFNQLFNELEESIKSRDPKMNNIFDQISSRIKRFNLLGYNIGYQYMYVLHSIIPLYNQYYRDDKK